MLLMISCFEKKIQIVHIDVDINENSMVPIKKNSMVKCHSKALRMLPPGSGQC